MFSVFTCNYFFLGLTADGRSDSPISMFDAPTNTHFPFHNPRFPPYPHPTVINPLAQIRQPLYVQNIIGGASPRQQSGNLSLLYNYTSKIQNIFLSLCLSTNIL